MSSAGRVVTRKAVVIGSGIAGIVAARVLTAYFEQVTIVERDGLADEAIRDAEPLSSIHGFRRFEKRVYHYENLPRYLENFVLLGDAVFAFNPVYAQGMSVAAMTALELGNCLRDHRAGTALPAKSVRSPGLPLAACRQRGRALAHYRRRLTSILTSLKPSIG